MDGSRRAAICRGDRAGALSRLRYASGRGGFHSLPDRGLSAAANDMENALAGYQARPLQAFLFSGDVDDTDEEGAWKRPIRFPLYHRCHC